MLLGDLHATLVQLAAIISTSRLSTMRSAYRADWASITIRQHKQRASIVPMDIFPHQILVLVLHVLLVHIHSLVMLRALSVRSVPSQITVLRAAHNAPQDLWQRSKARARANCVRLVAIG